MYTITFYSFKGGVGRTLALVNVAAELARMGRKVLLVDFDLEAPGLETFERLRPPQPHPGLVEYVTEYMRSKRSPDVRDYIYSAGAVGKKGGELLVMPAGRRDANYQRDLTRLNWKKLYEDCEGFLFFEDTKAQWEQEVKPDYVLIDSRTGHTDVKGICTRQLPDAVVVMFFPTEQNLVGLRAVCREIRSERDRGLQKNIGLHFAMSNVPDLDDEDRVLCRRLEAFYKELGIEKLGAVIHRYESVLLFNQAIFVLDRPRSRLAREYRRLVRAVITANPADREGALRFLHQYAQQYLPEVARDLAQEVDRKLGVPPIEDQPPFDDIDGSIEGLFGPDRLDQIAESFLDDADVLLRIAECRTLEGDYAKAIAVLNRALTVKPDLAQALFERAMCHARLGNRPAACADLLGYLQSPGLGSDDLLRAFRQLAVISPEKALEAVDLPAFQVRLSSKGDKVAVAEALAEMEKGKGLPRAIQILQEFRDGRWFPAGSLLFQALMRAQRWREALELLRSKFPATRGPDAPQLDLAMIRWGETGELPEDLCRQLLELDDEQGWLDDHPMAKCLLLWRTGQADRACRILENLMGSLPEHPRREFSYWSFRNVQPDQYLDDCRQLRRMIQGEPIRPPFLGDSSEAK